MHFGIVAVEASVEQLVEAFADAWPDHEPRARVALAGLSALDDWMRATQRPAISTPTSPDPGVDAFGFWQDGRWAVMLDPSYAQASDRRALAALSQRFGTALSFVIETSGACAFFDACRGGRLVRSLRSIDGVVSADGPRLPQEEGLPEAVYYMDETERLQRAFGLTPPSRVPADTPVVGQAFVDRTDYAALRRLH